MTAVPGPRGRVAPAAPERSQSRSNARGDAYSKMKRRKGIIALIVATVGLGVAALPAAPSCTPSPSSSITGERITRTVDVPPGTPVSPDLDPRHHGHDLAGHRQRPDRHADAERRRRRCPSRPSPPSPPSPRPAAPKPTSTPTPGRQREARRAQPDRRRGQPHGHARAPAGNQKLPRRQPQQQEAASASSSARRKKKARATQPGRALDGTPTLDNPTFSLAMPGAAPIGVPNFFIDKFRIPPFLLPLYQAAGIEYGVRWEVLAAINEIETDYGRNLNVSSAGALGWMQFMPATWKQYGVDANKDELKDPYNPVDAIFAAARYLKAAGAEQDLRKAIFAYNHADWYVDSVLMRARLIGGLPSNLVGSLTGLTQGHFPVAAKATYADDLSEAEAKKLGKRSRKQGNRALVVEGSKHRRGIKIFARRGAPVVAVNDGRIVRIGQHQAPRPLRPAPGRLRQHLHVRAPGEGRQDLPGAAPAHDDAQAGRQGARAARPRTPSRPRPPRRPPVRATKRARPPSATARQRPRQGRRRAAPRHHQAAPVRQPAAPERRARRRRAAAVRAHRQDRRQLELQELLLEGLRPRPQGRPDQEAAPGLARSSPARSSAASARPRARRPRTCCSRSARPAAAPRASTRSRSSTAGSCSSRPRSTAPRARTRSSAPTPSSPRSARSC